MKTALFAAIIVGTVANLISYALRLDTLKVSLQEGLLLSWLLSLGLSFFLAPSIRHIGE